MSWKITVNLDGLDDQARDIGVNKMTNLYTETVSGTPVDEGTLKGAWELDTTGANPTMRNPMPYTNRVMNMGHSKQAPPGFLDSLIDKYFGPFR